MPAAAPDALTATITADGKQVTATVPIGATVQQALDSAGVRLNTLDRVDPPSFTVLTSAAAVTVVRVREEFEVEENIVPFERQTVRNESLPEGRTLLIQSGENGTRQVTYRRVIEDGVERSRSVFKTIILSEPRAEIVMVGVQTPFTAVPIPGRLVYLTAGNAWMMESSTAARTPLVTTGDLDGHIFSLSPDGKWLLFTRKADKTDQGTINTLYMISLTEKNAKPVSLRVDNIIHFAEFIPGRGLTIAYSTVEPRSTPPGWQANNDLVFLTVSPAGVILKSEKILETNNGGIYGWWGTSYAWSPDGDRLAFARPDGVGLVDLEAHTLAPLIQLTPFQTRSDWAWVPGLRWSPDGNLLYTVNHAPLAGLENNEASPVFNTVAILPDSGQVIDLASQTGMFAYPIPSPDEGQRRYAVAYLQAIFPDRSETSRYRLATADHDGSNRQVIFPAEGSAGIEPQKVAWAPDVSEESIRWIGITYQGNLFLINSQNGQFRQITGDGSITRLDWK